MVEEQAGALRAAQAAAARDYEELEGRAARSAAQADEELQRLSERWASCDLQCDECGVYAAWCVLSAQVVQHSERCA